MKNQCIPPASSVCSKPMLNCPACRSRLPREGPNLCWKWRFGLVIPTQFKGKKKKKAADEAVAGTTALNIYWIIITHSGLWSLMSSCFLSRFFIKIKPFYKILPFFFFEELITFNGKGHSRTQKSEITPGHFILTGCCQFLSSVFIQKPRKLCQTCCNI